MNTKPTSRENFLTALDELIKNAGSTLVITTQQHSKYSNECKPEKPIDRVEIANGQVYWYPSPQDSLDDLIDCLLKAESLINEAREIAAYEKGTAMNHPNIYKAVMARQTVKNPYPC